MLAYIEFVAITNAFRGMILKKVYIMRENKMIIMEEKAYLVAKCMKSNETSKMFDANDCLN